MRSTDDCLLQLRDKLATGAVVSALTAGTKAKKVAKSAKGAARAASPASSLASSPPPAAKKKGKGKEKEKKPVKSRNGKQQAPRAQQFDGEGVSDLEGDDDDALLADLRAHEAAKAKAAGGGAEGEMDVDDEGDGQEKTPSSSSDTLASRKRDATNPPGGDSDGEDEEPVDRAVSQAKKRRVIVDSDDE